MDNFQRIIIDKALQNKDNKLSIVQLLSFFDTIIKSELPKTIKYSYIKKIHKSMSNVKHDVYDLKRIQLLSEKLAKIYTKGF